MTSFGSTTGNVLYLVVCGVPGADRTLQRIEIEQAKGWDVCLVCTDRALDWFDAHAAAQLTGHVIQSRMRRYPEPIFEPLGDAVVVAPASFNTINRIALGLTDNMPVGLVCEAIGRQVPVTIEPQTGGPFEQHPVFRPNIERLQRAGVVFDWGDRSPPV